MTTTVKTAESPEASTAEAGKADASTAETAALDASAAASVDALTPEEQAAIDDELLSDEQLWADIEKKEAAAKAGEDTDAPPAEAADKTGDEDTPPEDPPGEKSPGTQAAADKDDPFADATPEQKAAMDAAQSQIKKLEQSDRSNRGRLGSMQRQINQLSEQPAAPPAAAKAADTDTGGDKGYLESDDWKSFEDEYAEVAAPVRKLVTGLESKLDALGKDSVADKEARHRTFVTEQKALLLEEHSDWEQVITADGFGAWLAEEPVHIQEAATRNAKEIVDARQAADVVSRFKATLSAPPAADPAADKLAEAAAAKEAEEAGKATLSGKRLRQLDSAASTRTGGAGAATGIPEDGDEEAIWAAMDKQEARENRQRA